jgi:hypothetical protein
MTDTMISQNIDLSSWDTLYKASMLFPPLMQQPQDSSHGSDTQTTVHTDGCSTFIRALLKPITSARL